MGGLSLVAISGGFISNSDFMSSLELNKMYLI